MNKMDFKEYQEKAHTTAVYPDLNSLMISIGEKAGIVTLHVPEKKDEQEKLFKKMSVNFYYPALGLVGEAGEIANKVKKVMRDNFGILEEDKRKDLEKEIGDVLWYLAELSTALDIDLNKVAEDNLAKLFSRKKRGVIKGSGDNR